MGKRIITVALLAVLGTMAMSCQKETVGDFSTVAVQSVTAYTVTYYVDGVMSHISVKNDDELSFLLNRLAALARDGHRVAMHMGDTVSQLVTKEKVTFRTNSKEEAVAWCNSMMLDGYFVEIYFDETSGEYICIATK